MISTLPKGALLLAAASFIPTAPQPANWVVLLRDDFETAAHAWQLHGPATPDAAWRRVQDGANTVYAGQGHVWLTLPAQKWSDFRFRSRVKLLQGGMHINYRVSGCSRYFLGFGTGQATVSKQALDCSFTANPRGAWAGNHALGRWYEVEIVGLGGALRYYVDGALKLEYNDPDPLLMGGVAFEALPGSSVQVDDVEISGPPPPVTTPWVRTGGPIGGIGYDIRMRPDNPDVLFATDINAGISKSVDGGRTWFASNDGITSRAGAMGESIPIFCLSIDPHNPDVVWAGTQNLRGIFKSLDGGKTWEPKVNGIVEQTGITFRGFTVDPRDSNVVYAAAELSSSLWAGQTKTGLQFDLTKGVVYRSVDGGENWSAIWRGDNLARYVWIDPRDSEVMYVSTGIFDREAANSDMRNGVGGGIGIVKSNDGGKTWRSLNQANGLTGLYVGSLFMHPENPDILLAGAGVAAPSGLVVQGVFLSLDGGEHWRQGVSAETGRIVDSLITSVEFAVSDPRVAYAAGFNDFYRSSDGGLTWRLMAGGPPMNSYGPPGIATGFPVDLQVDPRNPDRVFINNYAGGNFLSEDGGRTWRSASKGYTGAQMTAIVVDPRDGRRVVANGVSGVFRSEDGGDNWRGLNLSSADRLALDPAEPERLIAAGGMGSIYLSLTQGMTWEWVYRHAEAAATLPPTLHRFVSVVFAPSNHRVVYGGMGNRIAVINGSADQGFGVYSSVDGGRKWQEANDGNTARQSINTLAVHPDNEKVVYAGAATGGVLLSRDGGRSWSSMNSGLRVRDVRALTIDPTNPSVVYAGLRFGGVYKSLDGGATWKAASAGMDPQADIRKILLDPANPHVLYAGALNAGVFRSSDGGGLWAQINTGLNVRAVMDLAISADGAILYAATDGGGVYRLDLKASGEGAATMISAASFSKDAPAAPESIVSVYGAGFAGALEQARVGPLPVTLGETSLRLTDSGGSDWWAPLYFVSPGQINFFLPGGATVGPAQVRVFRQGKVVARGTVQIETVAPGLFTANANGQGVPAAQAARYGAGGEPVPVPVFQCAGTCSPAAMDLGGENEQLILMLYGTGLRNARAVTATIGGVEAPVLGFAAQSQYPGLDQVNVRVPRELKGRGEVEVIVKADGKAANTVKVGIQ